MKGAKSLRLGEIYGASIIGLSCLCGVMINWGKSWFLVSILGFGVVICGIIVLLKILRAKKE